jgi:hypothetical protein
MFYVVIPYVRGWVEDYFTSLDAAKAYIKGVGFTGWVYLTETGEFVGEVRT